MWYVTFHGGDKGVNNVYAYDDNGEMVVKRVLPEQPALSGLRRIAFSADGHLCVVNGSEEYSQILRYSGKPKEDGSHEFIDVFSSRDIVDALVRPFSFAFDKFGHCYVSSQKTNVVTRLWYATGRPKAVAPYLAEVYPHNQLLAGTFVASSKGDLPDVSLAIPNVHPPQGLEVSLDSGKVSRSVRDVLVHRDWVIVADEPGNAVKIYHGGTGKLNIRIVNDDLLAAPVHLHANDDQIYIGSTGTKAVLRYDLGVGALLKFIQGIDSVSGMSFGRDGCFYAASRKERCILKYDEKGNFIEKFIKDLPDDPQFLLYVPGTP